MYMYIHTYIYIYIHIYIYIYIHTQVEAAAEENMRLQRASCCNLMRQNLGSEVGFRV